MQFEWLQRFRRGNEDIASTQGATTSVAPDKREIDRVNERRAERELSEYIRIKEKLEDKRTSSEVEFVEGVESRAEESGASVSTSDLEKALVTKEEEIISRIMGMILSRLLPGGGDDGDVLQIILGRVKWESIALLLAGLPTGAVSNMYLCIKHKDNPSLDTDSAKVFIKDGVGDPLWYIQFDYLRGTASP